MTKRGLFAKLARIAIAAPLVLYACDKDKPEGGDDKAPAAKVADAKKAGGEDDKPAVALPKAEDLLAKSVEAAGGKDAFAKIESFYYQGQLEIAGQKLEAKAELWWKKGDFYTEQNMGGVGKVRAGRKGGKIWAEDPVNGMRDLSGLEAEQITWQSHMMLPVEWQTYFSRAETVREDKVGDKAVYVVKLTSASGAELEVMFDKDGGLWRGMKFTQETPMGKIPVTLALEDYRDVAGIKMAYKQVTEMPLANATMEMIKLDVNAEISEARFEKHTADAEVVKKGEAAAPPPAG